MEVYLRYALTAEEVGVEVGEYETIGQFRENAAEEFDCDVEHVALHMGGVSIGNDEELVSAASCLTHASVVDVMVSMDVFVEHIRNGTRSYTDLPDSVQRDIPCALAALQCSLNRVEFGHLPPEVQTHPTIVEHVILASPHIFETAHPSAWNDEDFRVAVVHATNGFCLSWGCCEEFRSDRDTVFSCVKRDGEMLEYASNELRNCPVIVLASVQSCGMAIRFASEEVRRDPEIFTAAVIRDVWVPTWLPEALRADRGLALRCISMRSTALRAFSDELKGDPFVVTAAGSLEHASDDLKKDKEFVLSRMQANGRDLCYVDECLRSDRSVVMEAIASSPHAFSYACDSIRDEPDIALQCTVDCPDVARCYGDTLCQDKDFILSAIRTNAHAFRFVPSRWRDDEEVARLAVESSQEHFKVCSAALRGNRAFVLFAVQKGADLSYAPATLRSDAELCRAAQNNTDLEFAPPALRDDFEFVKKAVSTQGTDLQYASPALQDSYDIVLTAVQHSSQAFLSASPRLRKCETLAREALRHIRLRDGSATYTDCFRFLGTSLLDDKTFILSLTNPRLGYVSKRLQADPDVVLSCIREDGSELRYASSDLRGDRVVVEAAVTSEGEVKNTALQFASPRLQRDHSLVLLAVTHCGRSLQYASSDLQNNIDIVRAAVTQDWGSLNFANRTLLHMTDIVHNILPAHPQALQFASPEVRNDVSIVAPLAEKDVQCLAFAGPAVLSDHAFILSAVQQNPYAMQFASQDLQDDPDIAAALIEYPAGGSNVPLLSPKLLGNKEFMTKAITKHPSWLCSASLPLRNDPAFVVLAVRKDPYLIEHAGAGARADYNMMLEVIQCGVHLTHAAISLRNNLDFMTEAILADPENFEHASTALRNCKRVALLAMRGYNDNLQHASEALQNDPQVVLQSCIDDPSNIRFAGTKLKDNYAFCVKAVRKQHSLFRYLSSTLQTNPNFILACIHNGNQHQWKQHLNPSAWSHTALVLRLIPALGGKTVMTKADEKVRRKFKVALSCVKSDVTCLNLVSLQLRNDKDFIMACLKGSLDVSLIGKSLWCDADVVAKAVVTTTSAALQYASPTLQDNHDIVLTAVSHNGMNLQHASARLQATRLIANTAVHSTEAALPFASQTLREDVAFLIRMKLRGTDALHTAKTAQDKALFANRAFMLECVRRNGSNLQHASEALQDDVDVVLEALRSTTSAAAFASVSVLRHPRVRVLLWWRAALLTGCLVFLMYSKVV